MHILVFEREELKSIRKQRNIQLIVKPIFLCYLLLWVRIYKDGLSMILIDFTNCWTLRERGFYFLMPLLFWLFLFAYFVCNLCNCVFL